MRRVLRLLPVVLIVGTLPGAWAGDDPQVAVVSRSPSSIRVEATGFEVKPARALFYRVQFDGSEPAAKQPLPDGPFEIPTEGSGIHTLTIFSQKAANPDPDAKGKTQWSQDLFAVRYSERLADPDHRRALAERYAPVVLFHREEEFYPSSIPYILNEEEPDPELADEKVQVRTGKLNWTSMKYSELAQYVSTHGESRALVDTPRFRKIMQGQMDEIVVTRLRFRTGSPEQATLYYSVLEDPAERKAFIHYHFLYAYDPKAGNAEDPSRVGHVFDRESLTVVLSTETMQAEAVVFGAHLPNQTMGLFDIEGKKIFKWQGGRVRVPWDEVDRLGDHPFAAVARGSHGIYPLPGLYAVLEAKTKILKEAAGGNRVLVSREAFEGLDHLRNSAAVEIVPYTLLDLGLDQVTSRSWNRALLFSGSLVDVPGAINARFPPFTTREANPLSYCEEASEWPVAEIPTSAREHQELLLELMASPR